LYINETVQRNYHLLPDAKLLSEVVVTAHKEENAAGKTSYLITPNEVKGKTTALDLMNVIPEITFNPTTQTLSEFGKGAVKILINGMNASERDLLALRPEDVQKLEHYDIPPERYVTYGGVINVITKKKVDGWNGGLNLSNGLTAKYMNELLYFKYNKGKSQFSLNYYLNYRDYSSQFQNDFYQYEFDGMDYQRQQQLKNHFGYGMHQVTLGYIYQDANNAFQLKLSPNYTSRHKRGKSSINLLEGESSTFRDGTNRLFSSEFDPVVDAYYNRKLPHKAEVSANVVGSGFFTHTTYSNQEYASGTSSLLLNDKAKERNRKYSIYAEAYYDINLPFGQWTSGYSLEAYTMHSKVDNVFSNSSFTTNFSQNYLYTELTGQKGRWGYYASLGVSKNRNKTVEKTYNYWLFMPRFYLQYKLSYKGVNYLRLLFTRSMDEPNIASLSNNMSYVTDQIVKQGNPYLQRSDKNSISLSYVNYAPVIRYNIRFLYNYIKSPIIPYYKMGDDAIFYTYENGNNSQIYGADILFMLIPFKKNLLTASIRASVKNISFNSPSMGKYSHWYTPIIYQLNFLYKKWSAVYQGRVVSSNLDGLYLSDDENISWAQISYRLKKVILSIGCLWPLAKAKYYTRTIPQSLVAESFRTHIKDDNSLFTIGIVWNISQGATYKDRKRNLQYQDTDAGTFYK
jgi:hypothetical protein